MRSYIKKSSNNRHIVKSGDKYRENFTVTEKIYNGFIELFKDRNPLHVDNSYALSRGFKSKLMHGNILCGFVSYMAGECLPEKNIILISQEINYKKPVYLNDTLTLIFEVINFSEAVNVADISFVFLNSNNVKAATGKVQIKIFK